MERFFSRATPESAEEERQKEEEMRTLTDIARKIGKLVTQTEKAVAEAEKQGKSGGVSSDFLGRVRSAGATSRRISKKGTQVDKEELKEYLRTVREIEGELDNDTELSAFIKRYEKVRQRTTLASTKASDELDRTVNGRSVEAALSNNIQSISQQGIQQGVVQAGLGAVSPELGFAADFLGVNDFLGDKLDSLFQRDAENRDKDSDQSSQVFESAIQDQTEQLIEAQVGMTDQLEKNHREFVDKMDEIELGEDDGIFDSLGSMFGFGRKGGKGGFLRGAKKWGGRLLKGAGIIGGGYAMYDSMTSVNDYDDRGGLFEGADGGFSLMDSKGGAYLEGAAGGAATGAAIGSIIPGIGTAIGAIVGGALGALGTWLADNPEVIEEVIDIGKDIRDWFLDVWDHVVDWFTDLPPIEVIAAGALEGVRAVGETFVKFITDIPDMIVAGVVDAVEGLGEMAAELSNRIRERIVEALPDWASELLGFEVDEESAEEKSSETASDGFLSGITNWFSSDEEEQQAAKKAKARASTQKKESPQQSTAREGGASGSSPLVSNDLGVVLVAGGSL